MSDFDGPIADSLEALASKLRRASRVLLDEIAELKAENARLRDVVDLYEQYPEINAAVSALVTREGEAS